MPQPEHLRARRPIARCCRCDDGFTLLEVLVAITILTLGLLGVAAMQVSAINGNTFSGRITSGLTVAQARLEELMALPASAPELTAGTHQEASPPEGYTVSWTVTPDAPVVQARTIELVVTWPYKGGTKTCRLMYVKPDLG